MNKVTVLDMWSGDGRPAVPDFVAMAAKGITGIIHRATEGLQFTDPKYIDRREAALAAGLQWGAYHTIDASDVIGQTRQFFSAIGEQQNILLAVNFENGDQPAALHQLYSFCGAIDRTGGVSIVIRSADYVRTVMAPPSDAFQSPAMIGIAAYMQRHRFWSAATLFMNDAPNAPPYPWKDYFLRSVDPFPVDPAIGKAGATVVTGNSWAA